MTISAIRMSLCLLLLGLCLGAFAQWFHQPIAVYEPELIMNWVPNPDSPTIIIDLDYEEMPQ